MAQQNEQDNLTGDAEKKRHLMNESDIGSGEKTPGEEETDEQIRQIPQRIPESPKESK